MNYRRWWRHERNVVGFAAECARLALPHYRGDHRPNLVKAIETAEAYVRGEEIDRELTSPITDHDGAAASSAAAAYTSAVYSIPTRSGNITAGATAARAARTAAATAGVDPNAIRKAFVIWWARDWGIAPVDEDDEDLHTAIAALLAIGEEGQAKELVS